MTFDSTTFVCNPSPNFVPAVKPSNRLTPSPKGVRLHHGGGFHFSDFKPI